MKHSNTQLFKFFILILCFGLPSFSSAKVGTRTSVILKGNSIAANAYLFSYVDQLSSTVQSSLNVPGDWPAPASLPSSLTGWTFTETRADLKLEIADEAKAIMPTSFSCTIGFELKTYSTNGVYSSVPGGIKYLTVNYSKSQGLKYNQADVFQTTDLLLFSAKIVSISDLSLRQFLKISSTMTFREIAPKPEFGAPSPALITIYASKTNSGKEIGVGMSGSNDLFLWMDSLELEWAWVDDDQFVNVNNILIKRILGLTSSTGPHLEYDFKQATRICIPYSGTLSGFIYKLPNLYERGFVVFRARPIGLEINLISGKYEKCYGPWSITESQTLKYFVSQNSMGYVDLTADEFLPKLNWQFKSTFAEDGKRRDEIQYFDGLFKLRQTLVNSLQDQLVFVKEEVYDYQSRPAIEMIPVPVQESGLEFRKGFTKSENQAFLADKLDSDPTDCTINPAYIDENCGAALYYSSKNPWYLQSQNLNSIHSYIPNSGNASRTKFYPFVMVDYLKDNSGRIASKSMPGEVHKLSGGRTTDYFYVKPEQQELDRLFGEQIGYAEHYMKDVVRDPNGQLSVSIKNLSGKVVATYLSGVAATNTTPLPSSNENQLVTADLLRNPQLLVSDPNSGSKELVISSYFFVDVNGPYQFSYSLKPESYLTESCSLEQESNHCLDCVYDLEISILDNCGSEQIEQIGPDGSFYGPLKRRIGDTQVNLSCSTDFSYQSKNDQAIANNQNDFFSINLQVGTYQVIRKLKINQEVFNQYKSQIIETGLCKTETEFFNQELLRLNELECNPCQKYAQLKDNLEASKAQFISQKLELFELGTSPNSVQYNLEYSRLENEFDKQFEELRKSCDQIYLGCSGAEIVLLNDLRPNELYAGDPASSNYKPTILDVSNYSGTPSVLTGTKLLLSYKDLAYFNSHEGKNSSGQIVKLSNLNREEFLANWEDHFANELLPLHPEFARILYCQGTEETRKIDQKLMQINSFDEAVQQEFLKDILNVSVFNVQLDPINSVNSLFLSNTIKTQFSGYINTNALASPQLSGYTSLFPNSNLNLIQLATYLVFCRNLDNGNLADKLQCAQSRSIADINLCKTETKDLFWNTLKGLYLSLKSKLYEDGFQYYINTEPTYPVQIVYNSTSSIYPINLKHSYNRKLPDMERFYIPVSPTTNQVTTAQNQKADNCEFACEAYADAWMNQLSDCNFGSTQSQIEAKKLAVRTALINVCKEGCDDDNPYGASTVKPQSSSTNRSFKDVLIAQGVYSSPSCTETKITTPGPYNSNWHEKIDLSSPFQEIPDCGTKVVNDLIYGGFSSNFTGFCDEDNSELVSLARMTKVDRNDCPENTICRTCSDLERVYREFYLMNEVDETASNFSGVLQEFLNEKLGYALTLTEIETFFRECVDAPTGQSLPAYLKKFRSRFLIYKRDENGNQLAFLTPEIPVYTSLALANSELNSFERFLFPSLNKTRDWSTIYNRGVEDVLLAFNSGSNEKQNLDYPNPFGLTFVQPSMPSLTPVPLSKCACESLKTILTQSNAQAILQGMGMSMDQANKLNDLCTSIKDYFKNPNDPNSPSEQEFNDYLLSNYGQSQKVPCDLCPEGCGQQDPPPGEPTNPVPPPNPCSIFRAVIDSIMALQNPPMTNPNNLLLPINLNTSQLLAIYQDAIARDKNNTLVKLTNTSAANLIEWMKRYIEHCYNFPSGGGDFWTSPTYGIGKCTDNCSQDQIGGSGANGSCTSVCLAPNDKLLSLQIYLNKLAQVNPKLSIQNFACSSKVYELNNLAKRVYNYSPNIPQYINNPSLYNGSSPTTVEHLATVSLHNGPVQFLSLNIKDANGFSKDLALSMAQEPGMLNNFSVIVAFDNIRPAYDPRVLCPQPTNAFMVQATIKTFNAACEPVLIKRWVSGTYSENLTEIVDCEVKKTYKLCKTKPSDCQQQKELLARQNARIAYQTYINKFMEDLENAYLQKCISVAYSSNETFVMKYTSYQSHYTLYYYDAAGNLVQTVPPAGVKKLTSSSDFQNVDYRRTYGNANLPLIQPQHKLTTNYQYNTLNQLVQQNTPDAGISRFAYDRVGRLILSQNAKQAAAAGNLSSPAYLYSYTLYDPLGRITEVGQMNNQALFLNNPFANPSLLENPAQVTQLLINPATKTEITRTYYDQLPLGLVHPYYLSHHANRVAATAYFATYSNEISNSDHAVLYGYDERGNVELLVRYTKGLIPLNQQFKSVHYRFDQLSGKVNEVIYQEAKPDQYVHHYEYDAENRLVKSYSSTRLEAIHESAIDGLRPGLDAAYAYYLHGPLARTELGEIKVQGVDYAYTIMGWLKAVNSDQINAANDMGKDGFNGTLGGTTFTSDFPLDEMGFSLHYFEGDYAPVLKQNDGSSAEALHNAILQYPSFSALPTSLNATSPSLYNGNISRMITAIRQFSSPSPSLVSAYQYDQLNRITAANYHYLSANNTLTATEDWKNTFTYDANGNILSQFRNASGSNREMDDLKYFYKAYDKTNANAPITYSYTSSGALVNASGTPLDENQFDLTNQLSYVTDSKGSGTHSDDIDNQSNSFNYQYDEIGNLTQDISEEIEKIEWTVYGKIRRITRIASSSKPDLEFEYTPDGHRSVKIVIPKTGTMRSYTYYVRDAQGNILATYSRQFQKTIDYANLSYAQVNTSLIQKSSPESFAWFIANEHANGPSGFRNALKNDILSSSSATDWFLNHPSFNPELILGMEAELAKRVWFNYNRQMALEVLKNAGSLNFETLCTCMKNRKNLPSGPNYLAFMEHVLSKKSLREHYLNFLFNQEAWLYAGFFTQLGITMIDLQTDMSNLEDAIATAGIGVVYGHWLAAHAEGVCPNHIRDFGDYLLAHWDGAISEELSEIEDWSELYNNTDLDNLDFECEALDFNYLFSLLNSDNSANLRSTLINQVQGAGVTTLQQKKNWLIDWYFSNDPMGSIYLTALRNPSLVSNYQTNPGMLYGTPYATGMENYFQKIKNYFGQSMFDQLVTEFAQQSNLYVDEIKVDEFHLYGSNRLGVYEANKTISRRVARDLNLDNQITNNEYIIETPEEVLYLFSSYQLERGAKRYELANHLGNVLTVISDKKTANFTGSTFNHFTAERISATDYSPFGAPLAGRTWNGGEYRFGFNGMEKDDEVVGAGNAYNAEAWEYDARLGRRWNVDPMAAAAPGWSPYRAFFDNPLYYADPTGEYEQPKNGFQRFWNSVTFRGKYNRFDDFKKGVEALGGQVTNVNFGKKITYDIQYAYQQANPDYTPGSSTPENETVIATSRGWEFEAGAFSGNDFQNFYTSNLRVGEYNIFTGDVKGSGRVEAPMIDPIDFAAGFAGGLKALFSTGVRTIESQGLKQAGKYFVYQATDEAGVVRYVGITSRNVTVRAAEHQVKPDFQNLTFTQVESGLTEQTARVMEQKLINLHRLGKNGGTLLNKINSLSPKKWAANGIE